MKKRLLFILAGVAVLGAVVLAQSPIVRVPSLYALSTNRVSSTNLAVLVSGATAGNTNGGKLYLWMPGNITSWTTNAYGVIASTASTNGAYVQVENAGTATTMAVTTSTTSGSLDVTTNATVGGTLGVTGVLTASTSVNSPTATLGTLTVTNAATAGTLAVGGGSVIKAIYSTNYTVNFGTVGTNATVIVDATLPGAGTNSVTSLGYDASLATLPSGMSISGGVSATNTVTLRFYNGSITNSYSPVSRWIRMTVFQY